jgi:hypothetical protein
MAAGSSWRMQVTNGIYRVHVAVGNGNHLDGLYRVNVEGVLAVQGTPVSGNPWIEGDAVVAVNDGNLTIDSGPGAFNNRLCFLVITPISATQLIIGNPPLQVTFSGEPAIKYSLESSTNLSQWSTTTLAFTNQAWSANIDSTAAAQQFYRTRTEVSRPALLIYSNSFESFPGSEWSHANVDFTPIGSRQFLGRFAETTVRLTLTNLPLHTKLTVELDLFVIGSWNGNSPTNGPDLWSLNTTGGPQLLTTTFHASTTNTTLRQAFPGNFPGSAFAPQTAASEVNSLGYNPDGDAVYHLSYAFAHSTNRVEINFVGDPTEPLANESWGLDNLKIYLQDEPY